MFRGVVCKYIETGLQICITTFDHFNSNCMVRLLSISFLISTCYILRNIFDKNNRLQLCLCKIPLLKKIFSRSGNLSLCGWFASSRCVVFFAGIVLGIPNSLGLTQFLVICLLFLYLPSSFILSIIFHCRNIKTAFIPSVVFTSFGYQRTFVALNFVLYLL